MPDLARLTMPSGAKRFLAIPVVRSGLRWLWRLLLTTYIVFFLLLVTLRYLVLPGVPGRLPDIEQAAGRALGLPVKIERIETGWQGLNPRLVLAGVRLLDGQGLPALAFSRVEGILSWHSIWRFRPILASLTIDAPVLHIRRDGGGRITVAGLTTDGQGDGRAGDWLFEQRRIRIRDATVVWEDSGRQAPPLVLEDMQLLLDNRGDRHRFGFSALPPAHLAARLDVRGDLRGQPLAAPEKLSGHIFAEMAYADLAAWRAWVDYPMPLKQGRGALRLWGERNQGAFGLVADLALEDVQVRLGNNLPQLDLSSMRGRLEGKYRKDGWEAAGQRIELTTLSGIRVPPSDFRIAWQEQADDDGRISGRATANFIDLQALQRLSEYLPLDARSRELLGRHQPHGQITELRADWQAKAGVLKHYDVRAQFETLGLRAAGVFPGGSGLAGKLEANEHGGNLMLEGKAASLELPSVFPEARIPLSEVRAKARWTIDGKQVDVRLEQLAFTSPDAAGEAQGSYRHDGQGPGVIDLSASLSRAEGRSVWRYMPHAVNIDARNWLKRGITAGIASDVRLTLKGDLRHFPFADKSKGEFRITAKAKGATVDYAKGWPVITGIDGDLEFGVGMQIKAHTGMIEGTRLQSVAVSLPDFGAKEERLLVEGRIAGPTAGFLRFIEKSPVMAMLDNRTEGMQASGNGQLQLRLDLPLRGIERSRVQGEFGFVDNQVSLLEGLPPVRQVSGRIAFSENRIDAPEISGQFLGAPLRLNMRNEGELVSVRFSGGASIRELRKFSDHPLFDNLSGQTQWKGEVRMRRKQATFVIESDLSGISSSLPEPFNKSTNAPLPLRLEKSAPGEGEAGDRLHLTLREVAEMELVRRRKNGELAITQGRIGIGLPPPTMPAQGVAVNIRLPRLDADFWRNIALPPKTLEKTSSTPMASLPLTRINLDTSALRLLGRDFKRVELGAQKKGESWQIAVSAEEAEGALNWDITGKGVLRANLKRLSIPSEMAGSTPAQAEDALPDLDVRVGDLVLGGKPLGELNVKARNEGGKWQLENLSLTNPDGSLKGKGEWTTAGGQHTKLDFELDARDVGKLLDRMKMPGTVQRGTAKLKGTLNWDGPLTSLHYQSLSGNLAIKAENGQFSKVEPGVGRLLGLISPQSLFRRISGDFRDVTHKGLAFDTIEGKLNIRNGVVKTQAKDALKIDGPAVHVLISGEADIKTETQNLQVTVQPEMGGLAAVGVGAATLNPIVGGAVWLGSKLLQNPLNRAFADQYRVTGSWNDPKVEKLGQIPPTRTTADYYSSPVNVPEEAK